MRLITLHVIQFSVPNRLLNGYETLWLSVKQLDVLMIKENKTLIPINCNL